MPMPRFAPVATAPPQADMLSRNRAAARLGLSPAGVDKLVRSGILGDPISAEEVARLAGRPHLQVTSGALTVLRADARELATHSDYPSDSRRWTGFHVGHSDHDLEAASLRWWRSDPARVLNNELFVVTVATFPVAVYRIHEWIGTVVRVDEDIPRHRYAGQLIARVRPESAVTHTEHCPAHMRAIAGQIMASRVRVSSGGGPIGYLEPTADDAK